MVPPLSVGESGLLSNTRLYSSQGTRLGGLPLDEKFYVTCPRHGSRYDVTTGACVRGPSREDGFNQDLITYELRIEDEVIQVMLD
jgi:3-phenylpropionate/trans-cinnamate dioxygenase ferredoxin component